MNSHTSIDFALHEQKMAARRRDCRQLLKSLFITVAIYALYGLANSLPPWLHGPTGWAIFMVLVFMPLSVFLVAWPRLRDDCL